MNKQIALSSLLLLVLCNVSFAQTGGAKYIADDGMFSLWIPDGWVLREMPGRKYKVAVCQLIGNFAPNINIVDESFSGSLESYVDANLNVMPQMYERLGYKNFKVLLREVFRTATKQSGVRVVSQSEMNGTALRQTLFFFDGKDTRKLVVTCTTLAAGGEHYDLLFEKSLKTFQSQNAALNKRLQRTR